ncbi:DUF4346 domain-containing protein [Candidatus Woesearchaeota archaeon]|nr:DUF4346 domain-containing protein [Candidatus Woesearchaeota archaeon]
MKLHPIKIPRNLRFIEVKEFKKPVVIDKKCFLLIRLRNKKIEVGICNYNYEMIKAYRSKDPIALAKKIIDDKWITRLDHSAYLGKELTNAKNCLENNKKYVQEGA